MSESWNQSKKLMLVRKKQLERCLDIIIQIVSIMKLCAFAIFNWM